MVISHDECLQGSKHQSQWLWMCPHRTAGCVPAMAEMLWSHIVRRAGVKYRTEMLL